MRIIDKGSRHYLAVKLNTGDYHFLKKFIKSENIQTVKITESYLQKMLSVNIKAVVVMNMILLSEAQKKLTRKRAKIMFREMDTSFNEYKKTLRKFFEMLLQKQKKKVETE